MRVAIIGAGVSGLVCAHRLHAEHDVVLFEASDRAGGHANTVRVETEGGVYDLDTGFIVFNDRNYPNFERLLDELDVETQASLMSFGVSDGGGFEYNGASPNGLFASRMTRAASAGSVSTTRATSAAPALGFETMRSTCSAAAGWAGSVRSSCV